MQSWNFMFDGTGREDTPARFSDQKGARILLAEDDDEMRRMLALALYRAGYRVQECAGGVELLEILAGIVSGSEAPQFDLVVSDIRMPVVTGLELLECLHDKKSFGKPIILITAFGDEETKMKAQRFGVAAAIDKPFEISHLLSVIRMTLMSSTTDVEESGLPDGIQQFNKGNRLSAREREMGHHERRLD